MAVDLLRKSCLCSTPKLRACFYPLRCNVHSKTTKTIEELENVYNERKCFINISISRMSAKFTKRSFLFVRDQATYVNKRKKSTAGSQFFLLPSDLRNHTNLLFGDICFECNKAIVGDVVKMLFITAGLVGISIPLDATFSLISDNGYNRDNYRSKFHEFDMQQLCKNCYEKLPLELKKRLKKVEQAASRK